MKRKESTIKSFVIAITALLMSAFYVFGPLHNQILDWSHDLSHNVENFNHETSSISNKDVHDHDAHNFQDHHVESVAHNHGILELFNSFFDNANKENPSKEDTLLTNIKIDKHIVTHLRYLKFIELNTTFKEVKLLKDKSLHSGYLQKQIKPPA